MKIISKYKDYYDYLIGIYGEDNKLILDRRNNEPYYLYNNDKIDLYIADYKIEGLVVEGKYLYGEQLRPYIIDDINKNRIISYLLSTHYKRDYNKSHSIKYKDIVRWCYLEPIKDLELTNTKYNTPILIRSSMNKLSKYPKLSDLNLGSFISPETIYNWLSNWLSNQINIKESKVQELPDSLKIVNKGFDIKKSFRPKIK